MPRGRWKAGLQALWEQRAGFLVIVFMANLPDIDYLPGAAELGDFDATSTTIALAPGGEQGRLPEPLLTNTFERYWIKL